MSDYDEMMKRYTEAAAAELKPLIAEAAHALDLEDTAAIEQLGGYLTRAWMDGAMAGQESMLEQAKSQGFDVKNRVVQAPDSGSGRS